jgi:hypothetical protein
MYKYIILLLLGATSVHEFHMSRLDVNYKSDQQALQFSLFLFIDDFEATIKEENEAYDLKLFTDKEAIEADSLISDYIRRNLLIRLDNTDKEMSYIGRELDEKDLQGMWVYLEIENQTNFEIFNITNSLLTDTFDDQRNIINVKSDSKRKAYHILDKKNNNKKIEM